jgi:hypothetical protein
MPNEAVTYMPAPITRNFVPGGPGSDGCWPMARTSKCVSRWSDFSDYYSWRALTNPPCTSCLVARGKRVVASTTGLMATSHFISVAITRDAIDVIRHLDEDYQGIGNLRINNNSNNDVDFEPKGMEISYAVLAIFPMQALTRWRDRTLYALHNGYLPSDIRQGPLAPLQSLSLLLQYKLPLMCLSRSPHAPRQTAKNG